MNDKINIEKKPTEQQREETIKKLEYNYAHGNIDLEEFEKRLEIAINTSNLQDLIPLTLDLEEISVSSKESSNNRVNSGEVRSEETFISVLSGVTRKGVWKPARNNRIFVFMGGIDLDFSQAVLPPGETDFNFFCVMGGIDIRVPKGINVEVKGLPIMGGIDTKVSGDHYPGQPTLSFHGITFMGGVDIKYSKKKKKSK